MKLNVSFLSGSLAEIEAMTEPGFMFSLNCMLDREILVGGLFSGSSLRSLTRSKNDFSRASPPASVAFRRME